MDVPPEDLKQQQKGSDHSRNVQAGRDVNIKIEASSGGRASSIRIATDEDIEKFDPKTRALHQMAILMEKDRYGSDSGCGLLLAAPTAAVALYLLLRLLTS